MSAIAGLARVRRSAHRKAATDHRARAGAGRHDQPRRTTGARLYASGAGRRDQPRRTPTSAQACAAPPRRSETRTPPPDRPTETAAPRPRHPDRVTERRAADWPISRTAGHHQEPAGAQAVRSPVRSVIQLDSVEPGVGQQFSDMRDGIEVMKRCACPLLSAARVVIMADQPAVDDVVLGRRLNRDIAGAYGPGLAGEARQDGLCCRCWHQ